MWPCGHVAWDLTGEGDGKMGWDARAATNLPRMDWYPQDYLADPKTRAMTLEEHGAYLLLLQLEWVGGPLPADHGELAAMLGVGAKSFSRIWRRVSACFIESDGHLINERLERERGAMLAHRESKRTAGSNGGYAKARAASGAKQKRSSATVLPGVCQDSATGKIVGNRSPSPSPSPSLSLPTLSPEPEPVSPPPLRESFSGDAAPPQTLAPQTPQDPTTPEGFRLAWTAVRASRPVPLTDDAPAALHASAAVLLSRATGADPTWARAVIEAYHEQADEVVTRAGWSLRLFPHRINGLLAETKRALRSRSAQAASEAAMEPPMDALSQQEAAEAAREVLTRLKASKGVRV